MTTPINKYDLGDSIRLRSVFTIDGSIADPTDVTLEVKRPPGTVDNYATIDLVKQSTGIYYKDITLDDTGIWYYRFYGTGTVIAADEDSFIVQRTEF